MPGAQTHKYGPGYDISHLKASLPAISTPSLPPSLHYFLNYPNLGTGELFDYYLSTVCPRTSLRSTFSPFASVILPFCLSASPTLFKAIQALGHATGQGSIQAMVQSACVISVNVFRRSGSLTCSMDPEVLVIMIMLCLRDSGQV